MSIKLNNNLLITGIPGIGKTTVIKNICQTINNKYQNHFQIKGFFTEEVRNEKGERIGFDVIDVKNRLNRKQLSRIDLKSGPKVGKYCVDVKSFESIALPLISLSETELKSDKKLIIIIDEIGKMEMFSDMFRKTVKQLFESEIGSKSYRVLATIPIRSNLELVEELRQRLNIQEIEIKKSNRDHMSDRLVGMLCENAIR